MDRRTFIKTTGVAATAAPLVSGQKSNPSQIEHVVVVMMENRSFDHLFGWLPNADGLQAGLTFPNPAGGTSATFPLAPDYTSCSYPDPDHSYDGGRTEYDNGLMDGFLLDTANGLNAIGYYTQKDLPFRSALARNYTTCDRYFPSILAPTFPNRIFQHAGQTDRLDDSITISTLPTIWDNLAATGVSNKYYFGNVPFLALWGKKYLNICHPYSEFLSDCAAGTLPAVSFVDPSFTILSNLQNDDHPFSDVRNGDAFLAQAFAAVSKSPNWANTVFIINFDEWGGFFDHVTPPRALAPNDVDPDLVNGEALLGIRVACIIAQSAPTLAVDANANRHAISPYIYGINEYADTGLGASCTFRCAASAATPPPATTGRSMSATPRRLVFRKLCAVQRNARAARRFVLRPVPRGRICRPAP
jgi:phospholipase C